MAGDYQDTCISSTNSSSSSRTPTGVLMSTEINYEVTASLLLGSAEKKTNTFSSQLQPSALSAFRPYCLTSSNNNQGMKESNCEVNTLPQLGSVVKMINTLSCRLQLPAPSAIRPYHLTSSIDDQGMKESNCDVNTLPQLGSVAKMINTLSCRLQLPAPSAIRPYHLTSSIDDQGMKESNCEVTTLPHSRSAEKLINTFSCQLQLSELIYGGRSTFAEYLYAVDEIQKLSKSGMICSYETQGRTTKSLQLVFKGILTFSISGTKSDTLSSTVCTSSETSSSGYELQGSSRTEQGDLSSEQVYRLRSIAERLKFTECLDDCIEAYKISRKSAVDARFLRFGIGKWSVNDLQCLDCEEFNAKIKLWIQTANKCYNSIFAGERQYYEQIFDGVSTVTYHSCFLAIVEHVAIELNNFADSVSSIASFQKLFAVLDLYKALFVILPEIQNIFHTALSTNIYHGATKTIDNLATLVRQLFSSFEDTVLNERSNTPTRDGSIHSLTKYAMNYVTSISQYKELLTNIILSWPIGSLGYQMDEHLLEASGKSPLQLHMIWIMICLRMNLKGKSRCHEYSSLRYVFMMNNVNYMIKTITESPELMELIGKEYVSQLSKDVMQAAHNYFSSVWHRLLYCLRDDGLNNKFPYYKKISKDSLKDRFKAFNTTLEEACQTLSFVLDIQLRYQLHDLILCQLLPAYKSFLEKYSSHTLRKSNKERYIKYSAEDLEYAFATLTIHNGVAVDSGIN